MKSKIMASIIIVLILIPVPAVANLELECINGCLERENDQTADLIYRQSESTPITILWKSNQNPVPEGWSVNLYAGNPEIHASIPDRNQLSFNKKNGVWEASHDFSGEELGRGSFLVVTTLKKGNEENILDWRAFRLATKMQRRPWPPEPSSMWSIDVIPALLQVTTGHGDLPRARGGDKRVWWSLADAEGETGDLDIDGEYTGVPGIGVQVSTPWESRVSSDWKEEVKKHITGIQGHSVRFGEMEWTELPDRELDADEESGPVFLRHYYTVVTLYTAASVKTISGRDLGRGSSKTYFSHETTARLKPPNDSRFWSSYSIREYSADPKLLGLLTKHVKQNSKIPGLGIVQLDDGDGGLTVYRVGFVARVRPWNIPSENIPPNHRNKVFRPGFVGLDVVAARAGIGGVKTKGKEGRPENSNMLCKIIQCSDEGHDLDLNKPLPGYKVTQPVASLRTISGNLAMVEGEPEFAQKGIPNLPDETRFALGASLRAGALLRKGGFFLFPTVKNIVPIDSYAQFVVKLTVAMVPSTPMVANIEVNMPKPDELKVKTLKPPDRILAWLRDYLAFAVSMGLVIGCVALFLLVPGFREFVSSIFRLFAAFLNNISKRLSGQQKP